MLIAMTMLLSACQSSGGGGSSAGADLRAKETQQQAIERIEREGARSRAGLGL
ncbi:MAG: hypothetical protein RIM84_12535 [Alphaproteobacteria bacterium]